MDGPRKTVGQEALYTADDEIKKQFYDGKQFIPMRAVDLIISLHPKNYFLTPVTEKGADVIWRYDNNGIYDPYGVPFIEELLQRILGDDCTTNKVNEVINLFKVETYDWEKLLDTEETDYIVFLNGTYSISQKELLPHSPEYRVKTRIPLNYDPKADCPKIKQFLKDVFRIEDLPVIQEWMGYCLLRDYRYAVILFLIGDGANGKSTFLNLMEYILGTENVSHKTLFELNNVRFATSELYTELLNVSPDVSENEISHSGKLKALTGNEPISAERKHQNAFSFRNYAKLACAANKPPKSPDVTRAWFRRQLFVMCDHIFTPEEAKPNILEELTTQKELSGAINWMLEGLERLLKQGWFSRNETPEEIQEKYDLMSDPVTAFIDDCVNRQAGATIPKDDLYTAFRSYCRKRGFSVMLKSQLSKELKDRFGRDLSDTRPTIGNKRVTTWVGITLDYNYREKWEIGQGSQGSQGSLLYSPNHKMNKYSENNSSTPDTPDTLDRISPNEADLIKKAENILKLNKGKMRQDYFFDQLERVGHKRSDIDVVLRMKYKDRFAFMGLNVKLIGDGSQ